VTGYFKENNSRKPMPRIARGETVGGIYHIINKGKYENASV